MKKYFVSIVALLVAITVLSAQQSDPTLMIINGKNIPLSEFEYIYNKNNTSNVVDKKSLEEYVDLFVDFKLKVEEAIAQGLDTTQAFKSEFGMYRNQLADQYMTDEKEAERLLNEAYARMKEEVEISHILVRIPETGTAADTLSAYNKIMKYYQRVQKENFEKVAREVSEDPSVAQNGGYVGWISAMRTPYVFENAVYNTPVGKVSKPIRTIIGYHLVKVTGKRPSPGEVKVAHILLMNDRQNPSNNADVKRRTDSIYNRILAGDDFGELALKFSQDPGSASQRGELPWFGSGQMIPVFEKASFALKNNGDVSEPIMSQFGWHIIKLIDKRPLASFDEIKTNLASNIKQNDRGLKINQSYVENLKKQYDFQVNNKPLNDFYRIADLYVIGDSLFKTEIQKLNAQLASFSGNSISQTELGNKLINLPGFRGVKSDLITKSFENLVSERLKAYELTQLGKKHPDYRHLVQEYHDGILLFEVMNREVWDKATKDTEGLTKFFNANKSKYAWDEPRYKGRVIHAKDKATLKAAKNIVKRADRDSVDKFLHQRLNDSIQYVKIEKGLWKAGENKVVDAKIFKKAKYTPTSEYPYYFLSGKKLKNMPEDYTDVRGAVTADYQDYLEKNWITYLRGKYPVIIDEKVLKTVKKN
ncbi:MAG: hypothetical protein GX361_10140 [Bacteroidales bacterium]|nr:hypothetical protein [Bacteroidales bacterium]